MRWEGRQAMKILSKEEACEILGVESLDSLIDQLRSRLPLANDTYAMPFKSGVQIAISKLFAYLLLRGSPIYLYIACWGVMNEHLDLFYGYRQSLGERRPLIEAPVHCFEQSDEDAFISMLCMALFFSWDVSVFDAKRRLLVQISHDGWMEARASDEGDRKNFATELQKYGVSLFFQ